MKKKWWIFLGGLVITAVIGFSVVSHAGHYFSSPMGLGHMYRLNLLSEELGLTADQRAALKEIVLEQQKAFQSLHREFRPRLDTQLEKTRKELARVLTPEQAQKWERTFVRMHRFWLPPLPGESRGPLQGNTDQ
jgi:Spy/CpxP family protein refolding chaperone